MTRSIVGAVVVALFCIGIVLGDEAKGKVKSIDPDKGIVVITAKDRKSTRLNSSHIQKSRMPSSA